MEDKLRWNFNVFLLEIARELAGGDLQQMKFVLKGYVTSAKCDEMNALQYVEIFLWATMDLTFESIFFILPLKYDYLLVLFKPAAMCSLNSFADSKQLAPTQYTYV